MSTINVIIIQHNHYNQDDIMIAESSSSSSHLVLSFGNILTKFPEFLLTGFTVYYR